MKQFSKNISSSDVKLPLPKKKDKKTPEGVYAEGVRVSKNYVEWHWRVEQCINNKCVQERRICSVKYTRR